MAVLVALVLVMAAVVLPPVDGPRDDDARHAGRRRDLDTVVTANGLTYLGTYVLYTYVSILLLDSGAAERWVAATLLLFGACGLVGLRIAAAQLDRRPRGSAILVPALMAVGCSAVALAYPRLALLVAAGVVFNRFVVHQQDIQAVVNALWTGGATAVTIADQRVITTTGITCEGNAVLLQGVPYPQA